MKISILILCVLISFNCLAGQGFLTVGADDDCQYSTIQAAINDGMSEEIRIASNGSPYYENLLIQEVDKVLKGGYANCIDAAIDVMDGSYPVIDSQGGFSIQILGVQNNNIVELRHLRITNGAVGIFIQSLAKVDLLIDDSYVVNNAYRGLDIDLSDAKVTINDSTISGNQGGGIRCAGNLNEVILTGDTIVEHNLAQVNLDEDGGGMAIKSGCSATVFSPVIFQNNKTIRSGGGIMVAGGTSELSLFGGFVGCVNDICYGDNEQPVIIRNNLADSDFNGSGDGGGIAVKSDGVSTYAANVQFDGNVAYGGGAVKVEDGGFFGAYSYNNQGAGCWSPGRCSQFINNKAYYGGVALVTSGSASLIRSWVQGNRASSGVVGNIYSEGELTINNSMLVENGNWGNGGGYADRELFWVGDNTATLNLESVTIADNSIQEQLIENSEANVNVLSSLIANEGVDVYTASNALISNFECVLSHEKASFNAGDTVLVADPQFVDADNDDYRIKPTSPAVDFCYEINFGFTADIEFDEHGLDDPNHANLHGPYDVGADEYIWTDDVIFMDGFENL